MRPTDIFNHRTFKSRDKQRNYEVNRMKRRHGNDGSLSSRLSRKSNQKKTFGAPLTEREMNYLQRQRDTENHENRGLLSSRGHRKKSSMRKRRGNENARVSYNDGSYSARIGHRRTKTIGDRRQMWHEQERGNMRNSSTRLDKSANLKKKFALDLEKVENRGGERMNSSRYKKRKKKRSGASTDRSRSRLNGKRGTPIAKRGPNGSMTERYRRSSRDNFLNSISKKKAREKTPTSRSSLSRKENLRQRYLIEGKSRPRKNVKSSTDRRHYTGSRSYANDELRSIVERDRESEMNSARRMSLEKRSSAGRRKQSKGRKKRRKTPGYAREKGGNGSQTERSARGTSRSGMGRSKSRNSRGGGAMTERGQKRVYSDVVTGKARNLPRFEETKIILKKFGKVKGFGVNTHRGCVRDYNEDRVSILLNAQQRFKKIVEAGFKNCCLFGIYDGHGGSQCCNFLKEYLFSYILNEETFTNNTIETLKRSFKDVDLQFVEKIQKVHPLDCSGSCAIVLLILDNMLYFMNVGDSRAILSQRGGRRVIQCSKDHKPSRDSESIRIFQNDGIIYRVANIKGKNDPQMITARNSLELEKLKVLEQEDCVLYAGPFRVKPGGLSVSRTFGDIEAKKEIFGGRDGVIVPDPEISTHSIESDDDFVLMASDGVFDTVSNEQVVQIVYDTVSYYKQRSLDPYREYEQILGACVSNVMKTSLLQQSEDNVTVMIVCFKNLLDVV